MDFPGGSAVKNLPLEEEMATHSIFLLGKPHGQRSLAGYSPWDYRVVQQVNSSVQLLRRVQLFMTPWTAACQASLSITSNEQLNNNILTVRSRTIY